MRVLKFLVLLTVVLVFALPVSAKVSSTQLFYLVKQAFPDAEEVNVFIAKDDLEQEKDKIARSTVQFKVKAIVYDISSAIDIGSGTKKVSDNSVMIVYDNKLFNNTKNKLYILSKCKEKQISLVTSSMDYVESGALLGFIEENGEKQIILNLTHYDHLKPKFTSDVIQQLGINKVIPQDNLTSAQ